MRSTILTIAGSDSSGGAGLQADLKAIAANGGYGASVITAVTAQNTRGVVASHALPASVVRAQLDAVLDDLRVAAIKTGMLASEEIIEVVAESLGRHRPEAFVCDPVMISKSGYPLLPRRAVEALSREILPLARLVTPNADEAEALTGLTVRTPADAERAGYELLERGCGAALIKGGHFTEGRATDVLVTPKGSRQVEGRWIDNAHTHGTGCAYSAAIATHLGRGLGLGEAVALAKEFITEAIREGGAVGAGTGPTDPFFFMRTADGWRWIERVGAARVEEP